MSVLSQGTGNTPPSAAEMNTWMNCSRETLVSRLMDGEIGDAFAQSSIPTQSKTIGSKGKARNRVKMSEFLIEQELQQKQMGRRKTRDELADGLRISVYEKKLNTCACKHFWSWHPDQQLSDYWNSLAPAVRRNITSMVSQRPLAPWLLY